MKFEEHNYYKVLSEKANRNENNYTVKDIENYYLEELFDPVILLQQYNDNYSQRLTDEEFKKLGGKVPSGDDDGWLFDDLDPKEVLDHIKKHDKKWLLDNMCSINELDLDEITDIEESSNKYGNQIINLREDFENEVNPVIEDLQDNKHVQIISIDTSYKSISTYITFTFSGNMEQFDDEVLLMFDCDEDLMKIKLHDHSSFEARISDHEPGGRFLPGGDRVDDEEKDLNLVF